MSELRVHVLQELEPEPRACLEQALASCGGDVVIVTSGSEEQGDRYRVLIGGRPSREDLERSPELELLLVPFAGLPTSTVSLLADFPQLVVHTLHHNALATAEGAIGLLLAAARHTIPADRALRAGDWRMRYVTPSPSRILAGKTALLLGFGAIGNRLAKLLAAFDVELLAVRRRPQPDDPAWVHPIAELDALLPRAQILMVCLPETPTTRGLIDAARLAALPKGALLVNVGRGPVVEEQALYTALLNGHLGGAGIDVWYRYPPDEEARAHTPPSAFPFHELENVVLSPHRTAHGDINEPRRWRMIAEFLCAFVAGDPLPHRVDLDAGY